VPVLIHPEFWNRRRLMIPGRDPVELPTTSRQALAGADLDIIEERQPSFLLNHSVLIKGPVVITGCGHAGIVNIIRYACHLTGIDQVYAVMGGFHLGGPLFEPLIPRVCEELERLAPSVIVPRSLHRLGGPARLRRPVPRRV
jgi:7,8-dihydropterin-6-yl-methyl-4-(beta-D-ribofuranosyl)aminobenzene 5'-phosphate synthase